MPLYVVLISGNVGNLDSAKLTGYSNRYLFVRKSFYYVGILIDTFRIPFE